MLDLAGKLVRQTLGILDQHLVKGFRVQAEQAERHFAVKIANFRDKSSKVVDFLQRIEVNCFEVVRTNSAQYSVVDIEKSRFRQGKRPVVLVNNSFQLILGQKFKLQRKDCTREEGVKDIARWKRSFGGTPGLHHTSSS